MTNETEKQETKKKKLPTHGAFHVREGKNGGKAFWTKIGAAWAHDDGEGFNISLDVMPLDGKIVLRKPKADEAEGE